MQFIRKLQSIDRMEGWFQIASRNHVEKLPGIIEDALSEANMGYKDIDAIGVTYGPGLASSLLVGFTAAKALGERLSIPVIGVNHHAGHLHSVFMGEYATFNGGYVSNAGTYGFGWRSSSWF